MLTVSKGTLMLAVFEARAFSTTVMSILLIRLLWVMLLSGGMTLLQKNNSFVEATKIGASKAKPDAKVEFCAMLRMKGLGPRTVRKSG